MTCLALSSLKTTFNLVCTMYLNPTRVRHTRSIEHQTNHTNLLLTDGTESVCSDNEITKVSVTRTAGIDNPSGDSQNDLVESCESGSMTEINSAMAPTAQTQELDENALSAGVKLSVELDSEDNSEHSYNQNIKRQSMLGPNTEKTSHPQNDIATLPRRTKSEQNYVKTSTMQKRTSVIYIQQPSRFSSFWKIPVEKARADFKELSESGFFYDDKTTQIVCVRCGYELQDNPTLEKLNEDHIQKSPQCFKFLKNGNEDIPSCEKTHQEAKSTLKRNKELQPTTGNHSLPPNAEGVQILKFSGKASEQHKRLKTRPCKSAGVKRRAQKRNKSGRVRPRNCDDDQQQPTQQNQETSEETFKSRKVPNSRKRNLDQNLYLKIYDVRKKRKFISFESTSVPSQEQIDAIITELSHPNACLTDDSMKVILRLIGNKFPQYHIPCDMDKFFIADGVTALNTSVEFAQVIFVPPKGYEPSHNKRKKEEGIGHFMLLTNIGCIKIFTVCDSLEGRSMKLRTHEIIRKCLGFQEAPIMVVEEKAVSVQIGNIDCGLYVIAFLIDICSGNSKRLNTVVYNQEHMRGHLIDTIKCLSKNQPIQEFPAAKDDGIQRQNKLNVICKKIEFDT